MEDLPGNLQSDLKAKRIPRPLKRSSRWTLLFVGDHGQTVSVRRFKSLFYLLMGLLLVAVGAAAGLYLFNRQTFDENQRLRAETSRLREAVEALRYEKDVLTARLVLTEAGFQKESPEAPPPPAPPAQEAKGPSNASGEEKGSPEKASAPEPEAAPEPQPEPEPVPVQEFPAEQAPAPGEQTETGQEHAGEVESPPVSVENLAVVHEQDRPLLRVTFLVRKGDAEPESVSGHAFVVLKQQNDSSGDSWVLIPWAKVEEGRPSPANRGQFFSISRFKPMKFETTGVSDPGRFDLLTVYIFSTGGELILEKDFSMTAEEVEAG